MADDYDKIPQPPKKLKPVAKSLWNKIVKVLREKNLIQPTDFMCVDLVCRTYQMISDIEEELEKFKASNGGSVMQVSEKTGWQQAHQSVFLLRDLNADLCKYLAELGMSMAAITKITKEKKKTEKKQADPFEEFCQSHPDKDAI